MWRWRRGVGTRCVCKCGRRVEGCCYGVCCRSRGLRTSGVIGGTAWGGLPGWLLHDRLMVVARPRLPQTPCARNEHTACSHTMPRTSALYGSHVRRVRLALCMCAPSSSMLGAVQWSIVCGLAGRVHAAFVTLVMLAEKPPVHGCIKYPTLRCNGTS